MKRRDFLSAMLTSVGGAVLAAPGQAERAGQRRPRPKPAPSPDTLLRAARLGEAQLGVAIVDLDGSAGGLSYQAEVPLPPASTTKVVTALYALDRLGPAHRFATRVLRAGDMLVLAGGGDPELDTDGLAMLAAQTVRAAAGWKPSRFAVWGGALPRLSEITPGQAAHLAYNPALSGMILNFNRVHLGWRCDESCALTLTARADHHAPRAYSIAAGVRPGGGAWAHSDTGTTEHWQIPRAGLGRSGARWLPVRDPEAYAGDVFQTLCRAEGLALPAPEPLADLPVGTEIARRDSRPLTEVLGSMMNYSTNLTAEVVGLAASGAPGLRDSARAMADWLAATGAGQAVFADHSGLSADSRIAPAVMARLLARAESVAALRPLLKTDPLREALGREARGDGHNGAPLVAAKTGTLNFVSNLAGYARAADGTSRAFAVMVADLTRRAASEGTELPPGVLGWTERAKRLQRDVIAAASQGTATPAVPPPEI